MALRLGAIVTNGGTLLSVQDVLAHVDRIAGGLRPLLELGNGVGIIAVVMVVLCSGIVLVPTADKDEILYQMERLNVLLYAGAIMVVAWMFQSRLLYALAATTLIAEHQKYVQGIAPSISLVVGAGASVFLILMYMSGFLWLQSRFAAITGKTPMAEQAAEEKPHSPKSFLFTVWPRIFMLLGPAIPGTLELFFNFLDKL